MSNGSNTVPLSTAASTPMPTAKMTQMTAAPNTSDRVTGTAWTISGTTCSPWLEYDTRSREMKSFCIMIRYRMGNGRSSPNWWRISRMEDGEGLRPASWRAGSTPGVAKKIRNTSTLMPNMTATVPIKRRTMKVSI